MAKNYVGNTAMDSLRRKDENKSYGINEKRLTGYNDGEDPSIMQELPGEEIVEDIRELSRQQGQRGGDPTSLRGENVQPENDRQRYGDSISKNAEFQQRSGESNGESKNKSNNQNRY
ncbi:hypothetical protein [Neobacillus sp. DY30]|uniref:hypothetical protein n=1 Tax=Neobacillus sp. DY30 TaxID=3047871 RepID=UPI0024C00457|nr:hypothetical protein [Neobacillus sp. DY30]WHY00526.1 hypothetical protein QNH29_29070 [Neobacillus sp. DY30]